MTTIDTATAFTLISERPPQQHPQLDFTGRPARSPAEAAAIAMAGMSVNQAFDILQYFVPSDELAIMRKNCKGEEGDYFRQVAITYATRIVDMPVTGMQEQLGDQAIVHLHYFTGSCDWYITELDGDEEGQLGFGWANLGDDQNAEWGYMSIGELIENGAELDLHWKPRTMTEARERASRR